MAKWMRSGMSGRMSWACMLSATPTPLARPRSNWRRWLGGAVRADLLRNGHDEDGRLSWACDGRYDDDDFISQSKDRGVRTSEWLHFNPRGNDSRNQVTFGGSSLAIEQTEVDDAELTTCAAHLRRLFGLRAQTRLGTLVTKQDWVTLGIDPNTVPE